MRIISSLCLTAFIAASATSSFAGGLAVAEEVPEPEMEVEMIEPSGSSLGSDFLVLGIMAAFVAVASSASGD